jgi:hypothetical protein
MRIGDTVILKDDPLRYGYGRVDAILSDGRIRVQWEGGNINPIHPHRLALADQWQLAPTGWLTNADIQRLLFP